MKTAYEVACNLHSIACRVPESYVERAENPGVFREMWQEAIDSAYVLGLMIDAMPVELAEREI